jgi:hypothetical protein
MIKRNVPGSEYVNIPAKTLAADAYDDNNNNNNNSSSDKLKCCNCRMQRVIG